VTKVIGKPFKKGQSGNPNGRPPVLLPEVQKAVDANRNALKVLILSKLEGRVEEWVQNIIDQGIGDADIVKFKMLIELALGKMVDDPPEFPVSEEEKLILIEFRRRKSERDTSK
jgi:hypothetical protein